MTRNTNSSPVHEAQDSGTLRTLQALDQAAGGTGNVTSQPSTNAFPARPEHGTDDERCEDSVEHDRRRRQAADEVLFRLSERRDSSPPRDAREKAAPEGRSASGSSLTQERADAEIRAEIESRLKADQFLNEATIFVTVSHGRVIIEGSVENHEAKQRAEAISRQASGIVGHDSNLAVRASS
ncbi:MAG: BON domain-containing protein [Rhizobium sp.]|nr:MAG: BON domain-containing protein [Rhizobium sp.]